ncbi:MAG: SDR family oxidoreductase [Deltaproteobacteria bacterium]|nr:SDR family oxidoreductase [Deltaproteobacteria bacterium]
MSADAPPRRPAVLVLGASGALGGTLCEALHARGARLALTFCAHPEPARALAERLGASAHALDVTDPEAVTRVVTEVDRALGGLDALVYAAAIATTVPGLYQRWNDLDASGWDRLFAVNVRGAFLAAQALARCALPRGANVVFLGSVDGAKQVPTSVGYAASKSALTGLAHALTKDLGPRGLKVNVVAPGLLEGGLSTLVPEDIRREFLKHGALKRLGRFTEIASVVAWLAVENSYVTGRTIRVDGGL